MKGEFEKRVREIVFFDEKLSDIWWVKKELLEIVDEFQKEFRSIIQVKDPLDWFHHTGEIKQKLEQFDKRWFGDEEKDI